MLYSKVLRQESKNLVILHSLAWALESLNTFSSYLVVAMIGIEFIPNSS